MTFFSYVLRKTNAVTDNYVTQYSLKKWKPPSFHTPHYPRSDVSEKKKPTTSRKNVSVTRYCNRISPTSGAKIKNESISIYRMMKEFPRTVYEKKPPLSLSKRKRTAEAICKSKILCSHAKYRRGSQLIESDRQRGNGERIYERPIVRLLSTEDL